MTLAALHSRVTAAEAENERLDILVNHLLVMRREDLEVRKEYRKKLNEKLWSVRKELDQT